MRYALANAFYRLRFPSGWLSGTDFRPHFDGYLINACTRIPTGLEDVGIEAALMRRLNQSYRWMRLLRYFLRRGDRVQYCLGTTNPRRQYLKAWSSWEDLANGVAPRDVVEYWHSEAQGSAASASSP